MRTFKQFLLENETLSDKDTEAIIVWIKENCGPWLRASHGKWFYRGIKVHNNVNGLDFLPTDLTDKVEGDLKGIIWYGHTRKNRTPVDSSQELHDAQDKISVKKLGVPLRSNCLFVTKNRMIASRYGKCFAVIPIGEVKYAYPKIWDDSYISLKSAYAMYNGSTTESGREDYTPKNMFLEWLKKNSASVKAAFAAADKAGYSTTVEEIVSYLNNGIGEYKAKSAIEKIFVPRWIETTPSLFEWNKNLSSAGLDTEVMVYCDNYLAIDLHYLINNLQSLGKI